MNYCQISARELAEFCFPEGSLGTVPSVDRMLVGTRAHTKLQNIYSEDENIKYQREVPLEYDFSHSDISLKISGRADGIIFDKTDYCIHEIKSTFIAAETISAPLSKSHKAQAMIYAYIFALDNELSKIKCRLSYFCLNDEQIVDFEFSFDFDGLKRVVESMILQYLTVLSLQIKNRELFIASKEKLKFPYKTFRKFQRDGAAQVYSAVKNNKNLFLQAPTGSGKTMMCLFPTVKGVEDERIVYLCAKNQTMQVVENATELMRECGLKMRSLFISAKAKSCLMEKIDCNPENCPYSLNFYQKISSILPKILLEEKYSFDFIQGIAKKYEVCPYELSLELCKYSDLIVADYNYLFDPCVYIHRLFDDNTGYRFSLLVDEAHNLPERGNDMYSCVISKKEIRQQRSEFDKKSKQYKKLSKIITEINKLSDTEINKDALKNVSFACLSAIEAIDETNNNVDPLFIQELVRFSTIQPLCNDECFEYIKNADKIKIQCLDSSRFLEKSISKSSSAILYSATLSPYEFYKNSILPESESFGFDLPYPFSKDNLTVLADYSIDTRYANREHFFNKIAKNIEQCFQTVKKNIVVYFPSYAFLNAVLEEISIDVFCQKPEMNLEEKLSFVENFSNEHICAFAVMGSHFAEGIDLKNLSGIIIVGIALPQFNEERENIKKHFDKIGKGFKYAYLYPGINKVCQASGRLIRNDNDKGFILLLDSRFRQNGFLLPKHWSVREIDDISKDLAGF